MPIALVLDTSVLRQEGLASRNAHLLSRLASSDEVDLYVPEIAAREFKSQRVLEVLSQVEKIQGAIGEMSRQVDAKGQTQGELAAIKARILELGTMAVKEVEADFSMWMKSSSANLIAFDPAVMGGVLDDYFLGVGAFRKPKERDDIPDAIISAGVRALLGRYERVHIALKDGVLKRHLRAEPKYTLVDALSEFFTLQHVATVIAALDAVRTAIDAKQIAVSIDLDPTATRVMGDPDRLQQVVWNLLVNAAKFTPKDGTVRVSLRRIGTSIELKVADSGEGIAPDFLPHVFERFQQAEGSASRRHGGLGLGLALVRYLVEAHGGVVRADSAGTGHGATFTVILPVQAVFAESIVTAPAMRTSAREFAPKPTRLAGVSVLVVDDEMDARDLVATTLRANGAEVTPASSAAEALELVGARAFMVMVSDIGMPYTDGYELIGRVRTTVGVRGRQLPAVALTAYAREEDRRRALDAGYNAYVAKPANPDELVEIVASVVNTALKLADT